MTNLDRTEYGEQQALFEWVEWASNQHPALNYLMAIPNGQYRPGQRMEAGLRAGVPDVFLPVPCKDKAGLWIELKLPGKQPTADQWEWLRFLARQGYEAKVCHGFEEAQTVILNYLSTLKVLNRG
jgi:hypothetical protein